MPMFWRKVLAFKVGLVKFFSASGPDRSQEKQERWLKDLKLLDWGSRSLFPEYLEMGKIKLLLLPILCEGTIFLLFNCN